MIWMLVAFLAAIEYYGVAITLLARKNGKKNYALNLIPFVAPFYVQKFTGGFKMTVIPVKKWGQTVLIFAFVIALAVYCGTACFGYYVLEQAEAIRDICYIPIYACFAFYYLGAVYSIKRIIDVNKAEVPCAALLCALYLPAPFLATAGEKANNDLKAKE